MGVRWGGGLGFGVDGMVGVEVLWVGGWTRDLGVQDFWGVVPFRMDRMRVKMPAAHAWPLPFQIPTFVTLPPYQTLLSTVSTDTLCYRYFTEGNLDPIAVTAGIVQTGLYLDFFYVYFTKCVFLFFRVSSLWVMY